MAEDEVSMETVAEALEKAVTALELLTIGLVALNQKIDAVADLVVSHEAMLREITDGRSQ